jgi:hypothetical protein
MTPRVESPSDTEKCDLFLLHTGIDGKKMVGRRRWSIGVLVCLGILPIFGIEKRLECHQVQLSVRNDDESLALDNECHWRN